jgi:hypothetical protein
MRYQLVCRRPLGPRTERQWVEWHRTLASALDAFLDCQQRAWVTVALIPTDDVPARPTPTGQLAFLFKEHP